MEPDTFAPGHSVEEVEEQHPPLLRTEECVEPERLACYAKKASISTSFRVWALRQEDSNNACESNDNLLNHL